MSAWFRTVASRRSFDSTLVRVREDELVGPAGESLTRLVVELDDAVGVVPVMDDDTVVLLRQYRHPVAASLLEIPAGRLDIAGEAPEDAAGRELAEEAGLAAASLEPLVTFVNSAGVTDERTTVYLATGLRAVSAPVGFAPKAEEAHIEIVRLPLSAAIAAVRDGTIVDAKTVIGLLLVAERRGAGA